MTQKLMMWRWQDVKMWGCEGVMMRRCEDEKMRRCKDVRMRRWHTHTQAQTHTHTKRQTWDAQTDTQTDTRTHTHTLTAKSSLLWPPQQSKGGWSSWPALGDLHLIARNFAMCACILAILTWKAGFSTVQSTCEQEPAASWCHVGKCDDKQCHGTCCW